MNSFSHTPALCTYYIPSFRYAALLLRNPSSEYWFFFFFLSWNVQIQDSLILLPSAAAQVYLQLEIGGWCKTHHQNHNCHGNCPSWQQIRQTHILWNTERYTWWLTRASCEVVWWKSEWNRHRFIWKSYAGLFGCNCAVGDKTLL